MPHEPAAVVCHPGADRKARIGRFLAVAAASLLVMPGPAAADAAAATITLFGTAQPIMASNVETRSVEVGLRFSADAPGQAVGVRFYKSSANGGTHVGHLWTSTGTKLATATFTGESGSGWQSATFSAPVALTPGAIYVVSYVAPEGHYAADSGFAGRDNAPLHAPDGNNGVYHYGAGGGFPTDTYQATNYWVDVNFAPDPSATTTAPAGFVVRDASNTGPTGTLHSCPAGDITTPGAVIQDCLVNGDLAVLADNVTIENSQINGAVKLGRSVSNSVERHVSHPTVVDSELIGGGGLSGILGVNDDDGVYQRNDLHGWQNCATMWTSTRAQLLDNYCHNPDGPSDSHFDGFEVYGTVGGIVVSGNHVIETGHTNHDVAPLNVTNESPIQGTVVVERNLVESGSTAYVILMADVRTGHGGITAVINGNRLKRFQGGSYLDLRNTSAASSYHGGGNIDADTGAPMPVG